MDINFTLVVQGVAFFAFIYATMKLVWPPLTKAMEEREQRISEGLAVAERSAHEKELAESKAVERIREAKQQAQEIIRQAEKRANELIDQAKQQAREEGEKQLASARSEIELETNRAREQLRAQVADIAVAGASRILKREIDAKAHQQLIDDLAAQL